VKAKRFILCAVLLVIGCLCVFFVFQLKYHTWLPLDLMDLDGIVEGYPDIQVKVARNSKANEILLLLFDIQNPYIEGIHVSTDLKEVGFAVPGLIVRTPKGYKAPRSVFEGVPFLNRLDVDISEQQESIEIWVKGPIGKVYLDLNQTIDDTAFHLLCYEKKIIIPKKTKEGDTWISDSDRGIPQK
jgi:hypothetical protein